MSEYSSPLAAALPAAAVLSVSALNRLARNSLEAAFPLLWVGGEVSNLTYAASGHVYFSLKDAQAQVRCTLWRNRAQLLGFRLENGQKVEARVLPTLYEARGEFQLTVEAVRRAGQGDLYERFLRLKAQLEGEGLFAAETRRPLPAFPRRLAIVTSPQAAALRDVLSTLARRAPQVALTLFPCLVQGQGAAASIAAALTAAGASACDAVLLCRGGGSLEDLWAFNEEAVARAIRACARPVVSGVGHETDVTIADFAADLRAATPTAAAELIAPERQALLQRLFRLEQQLQRQLDAGLAQKQQQLDGLSRRLLHPAERLLRQRQDLQRLEQRLDAALRQRQLQRQYRLQGLESRLQRRRMELIPDGERLNALNLRLRHAGQRQNASRQARLAGLAGSLQQLNPQAVLARGFSLALQPDGRIVRDSAALAAGQPLRLVLARGAAAVAVTAVEPAAEVVAMPQAE